MIHDERAKYLECAGLTALWFDDASPRLKRRQAGALQGGGLFQHAGEFFEVVDEAAMFEPASFIIRGPED